MGRALPLIVALLVAPAAATAQDAPLDAAMTAYRAGNIEEALAAFERAERAPNARPEELFQVHLHLGIIHAVIGDADAARRSFAIALALRPDTEAPAELAPVQRELFEQVRANAHAIELRVEAVGPASNAEPSTLRLRALNAPPGLVARYRTSATPAGGGDPWTAAVEASDPTEVPVPALAWRAAERLDVSVEALNAHGGVLARTELALTQAANASADPLPLGDPPTSDEHGGGSVAQEAWFWIVIGVVVAGGVAAGVSLALTVGPDSYVLEPPTIQR